MPATTSSSATSLSELDRRIVLATQAGLPLDPRPFHRVAHMIGASPELVGARLKAMLASGQIRRIGVVPNHYRLGYVANGMTVWDVPDRCVARYGERIGALDFVSHCYHRPRHRPVWPYNLFAMVHGENRTVVREKAAVIANMLGNDCTDHDVLFSKRILKKTGLRLGQPQTSSSRY
ncbi:MAG: Lrp/AsnC family transcriptional regulator [Gammaproteobacteria bacterium]|nr:Lrp/AsnC family transcriptional regulator [Gammaproteobacteria bacterium]MDH3465640.1 Lrp/AsnC family transcriptional regulator [Gammaproteobacteria bacterium]